MCAVLDFLLPCSKSLAQKDGDNTFRQKRIPKLGGYPIADRFGKSPASPQHLCSRWHRGLLRLLPVMKPEILGFAVGTGEVLDRPPLLGQMLDNYLQFLLRAVFSAF